MPIGFSFAESLYGFPHSFINWASDGGGGSGRADDPDISERLLAIDEDVLERERVGIGIVSGIGGGGTESMIIWHLRKASSR